MRVLVQDQLSLDTNVLQYVNRLSGKKKNPGQIWNEVHVKIFLLETPLYIKDPESPVLQKEDPSTLLTSALWHTGWISPLRHTLEQRDGWEVPGCMKMKALP